MRAVERDDLDDGLELFAGTEALVSADPAFVTCPRRPPRSAVEADRRVFGGPTERTDGGRNYIECQLRSLRAAPRGGSGFFRETAPLRRERRKAAARALGAEDREEDVRAREADVERGLARAVQLVTATTRRSRPLKR